jgi:hypothetical protein
MVSHDTVIKAQGRIVRPHHWTMPDELRHRERYEMNVKNLWLIWAASLSGREQ